MQVLNIAARLRDEHGDGISLPAVVVCISAKEGTGVDGISAALEPLLANDHNHGHGTGSMYY